MPTVIVKRIWQYLCSLQQPFSTYPDYGEEKESEELRGKVIVDARFNYGGSAVYVLTNGK